MVEALPASRLGYALVPSGLALVPAYQHVEVLTMLPTAIQWHLIAQGIRGHHTHSAHGLSGYENTGRQIVA